MALEWTPLGITVNAIAPGAIETEMSAALLPGPEALTRFVETQVPAGRPGQPDDVVGAAIFLASRAADYVTGQALFVDGGWSVT
jgi:2-deoxy-D-gluconate 3-dehydrogenase